MEIHQEHRKKRQGYGILNLKIRNKINERNSGKRNFLLADVNDSPEEWVMEDEICVGRLVCTLIKNVFSKTVIDKQTIDNAVTTY